MFMLFSPVMSDLINSKFALFFHRSTSLGQQHGLDLETVRLRLLNGVYPNAAEFSKDIFLAFNNAVTIYPHAGAVPEVAKAMQERFTLMLNERIRSLKSDPSLSTTLSSSISCEQSSASDVPPGVFGFVCGILYHALDQTAVTTFGEPACPFFFLESLLPSECTTKNKVSAYKYSSRCSACWFILEELAASTIGTNEINVI
jgi:hypothetical protein